MPDGTLVFAAQEASEAIMLIHRSPEGAHSAKNEYAGIPLLAVATDVDLRGVEPAGPIESWNFGRTQHRFLCADSGNVD